jgi:hypothetical protein
MTNICYLCRQPIKTKHQNDDHIIPNALFLKGDPHRPKLPTHHKCNERKSKDDQWFIKQLQLRCNFNKEVKIKTTEFLKKAFKERGVIEFYILAIT